jgi:eukaryotic-like serine/threonine-protein kinase
MGAATRDHRRFGNTGDMTRASQTDPGRGDLPLGTRPIPFLAVLAGVVFVAVMLMTALANLVGAGLLEGGPALTDVPDLVGEDEAGAVALLEEAGLTVEVTTAQNIRIPPGVVIDQKPLAGERVASDATVTITISIGDGFARVPDLTGSPRDELFLILVSYELRVGEVTYEESDTTEDEVLRQDPAPGELLELGGVVDVVLSSGPPMIDIPDVRGDEEIDAVRALRSAGFEVYVVDQFSSWISVGHAVGTHPRAGGSAPRGSTIVLLISEGPPPTTTTEPPDDEDEDEPTTTTSSTTTTTRPTTTTAPTTTAPTTTSTSSTTIPPDDD